MINMKKEYVNKYVKEILGGLRWACRDPTE
jgi:hypothetical protein